MGTLEFSGDLMDPMNDSRERNREAFGSLSQWGLEDDVPLIHEWHHSLLPIKRDSTC